MDSTTPNEKNVAQNTETTIPAFFQFPKADLNRSNKANVKNKTMAAGNNVSLNKT